jgi:hypothetical protein
VTVDATHVPPRRVADLVVRVQDDETLVLDTRTDTAHCLPADVARVWDACVPGRTLAEVAVAADVDDTVAAASIQQLTEAELLDVRTGLDRRKFLRRTVLVGGTAAAIPLIQTVVGPLANAAASPPAPTCHAVIDQQTCVQGHGHKADYILTVSGFPATVTTYHVVVTYKNGSVSDDFDITTTAAGSSTSGPHTTGAAIPQGGVQDVKIQVFTLAGVLVCQDTGLVFNEC